jgi:predicted metal-dependent peptidase
VNGVHLGYDPAFVMKQSSAELTALLAHEVMHCASGHPWRRDARDPGRWNEACDRVINPILRDAGHKLPEGALFELEPAHKGKSSEWVYDRIIPPPSQGQGSGPARPQASAGQQGPGSGSGQGQTPPSGPPGSPPQGQGNDPAGPQDRPNTPGAGSGGPSAPQGRRDEASGKGPGHKSDPGNPGHKSDPLGEVRDAPPLTDADDEDATASEEAWKRAVQQAANVAKMRGKLPGSLERFAAKAAEARVDWRSAMRRFVQEVATSDYSFARPNARYVASGLILPGLRSQEVGIVAVAVDTSGSVDQVLLNHFAAELQSIVDEVRPRETRVLYCDAKVQREETFLPDDVIALKPYGGGGTDFAPVFHAIEQWDEDPVVVVYLTDLLGSFPRKEPEMPVLWVTGPNDRPRPVPFGEVLTAEE